MELPLRRNVRHCCYCCFCSADVTNKFEHLPKRSLDLCATNAYCTAHLTQPTTGTNLPPHPPHPLEPHRVPHPNPPWGRDDDDDDGDVGDGELIHMYYVVGPCTSWPRALSLTLARALSAAGRQATASASASGSAHRAARSSLPLRLVCTYNGRP